MAECSATRSKALRKTGEEGSHKTSGLLNNTVEAIDAQGLEILYSVRVRSMPEGLQSNMLPQKKKQTI